jgi:hypothetical protein
MYLLIYPVHPPYILQLELQIDYAKLVSNLTRAECDAFLGDLAEGKRGVIQSLRKRLRDFSPKKTSVSPKAPRSLAQLRQRAKILQIAEQKRQAEATRRKHIQDAMCNFISQKLIRRNLTVYG